MTNNPNTIKTLSLETCLKSIKFRNVLWQKAILSKNLPEFSYHHNNKGNE